MISRDLEGGRAFLAPILAGGGAPSRQRALALYGDGLFAFWRGALAESRQRNEDALAAAQAVDDQEALALAHVGLSRASLSAGDAASATSLAAAAREHARGLDPALGQAPLHLHAQSIRIGGDLDTAAALFEESLALNRRLDDRSMVGVELHNLGHVEIRRGNADAAERLFAELAAFDHADDPYSTAMTLLNEAALAVARGETSRAQALLARIDSIVDGSGIELAVDDRLELDWVRDELAER